MRQISILTVLLCLLASGVFAVTMKVPVDVACRTSSAKLPPSPAPQIPGDGNNHDSRKLTVRAGDRGEKSWIKFDKLNTLDLTGLRGATLTLFLLENEAGANAVDVSAVNDNCLDNINWAERAITWNNAPGNLITDFQLLDSTKTSVLTTLNFTDALMGDSFNIDVFSVIQADTDGIVQFVLHNNPSSTQNNNFCTWDNTEHPEWLPYMTLEFPPDGADYPVPADKATVETTLSSLSWTNPDPNIPGTPITCDVYLGTDPNRLLMDKATLGANVATVAINTTNFPTFGALVDKTTYYWFVDCHDSSKIPNPIPGEKWSFSTYNNNPPVVDVGSDQITWGLPKTITLNATVTDDGLPVPPTLTYTWTRIAGPATAVINSPNTKDTTVNITERGDYRFQLTASDSEKEGTDSLQVVVGTDACDASHLDTGDDYNAADQNKDCYVDIDDLKVLIIDQWLHCTDTINNCGI